MNLKRSVLTVVSCGVLGAVAGSFYVSHRIASRASEVRKDGKTAFKRFGFAADMPGEGWIARLNQNDPVPLDEPGVMLLQQEKGLRISITVTSDAEAEAIMLQGRAMCLAAGIDTTEVAGHDGTKGFAAVTAVENKPARFALVSTPFKGRPGRAITLALVGPIEEDAELIQAANAVLKSIEPL